MQDSSSPGAQLETTGLNSIEQLTFNREKNGRNISKRNRGRPFPRTHRQETDAEKKNKQKYSVDQLDVTNVELNLEWTEHLLILNTIRLYFMMTCIFHVNQNSY